MKNDTKTEHEKWVQYELEKSELRERDLTPQEYEQEIRKICERLRV